MDVLPILAQSTPDPRNAWAPVVLLIVLGLGFVISTIIFSILLGPGRTGPGKETTYESGMIPTGDARRRFNVRFYLMAMIFLVFDVEIIFFYPWATLFPGSVVANHPLATVMLVEMLIFVIVLLVAYAYAWGKGVFR